MTESLARKHRPRTFRDLVGQNVTRAVLMSMIHERNLTPRAEPAVPPGILLAGQRGCGKTTTARILAAALNCEAPGERPCDACDSCRAVAAGRSTAVVELDAASNGGVAEVRQLREMVMYSAGSPWRVIILDEVHSASKEAFNALLKVLEEPPPRTVFVLCTTERAKVLKTVASRCMPFTFRRIPVPDIIARLNTVCGKEGIIAEPALLTEVAATADGAMRDALTALEEVWAAGVTTLEQYRKLTGETDFAPDMLAACAAGDYKGALGYLNFVLSERADFTAISAELVYCLADVLQLLGGGEVTATGLALDARQDLARSVNAARVVSAMRVLWDLRTRIQGDAHSSLVLALTMVTEKLAVPRPAAPVLAAPQNGNHNADAPMTVDQMAALVGGA